MNIGALEKLLPRRWRGRALQILGGDRLAQRWYDPDAWQDHDVVMKPGEEFPNFEKPHRALVLDWVMRLAARHSSLLEVACHQGSYIAALRARGYAGKYVGIDITPKFLEAARKRLPAEDFRWGDARNLDFPAGAFDLVMATGILMHLPQPKKTLLDVFRIARKYVILSVYGSHGRTRCWRRGSDMPGLDFFFSKADILSWIPPGWEVAEFKEIVRPSVRAKPTRNLFHQYLVQRA